MKSIKSLLLISMLLASPAVRAHGGGGCCAPQQPTSSAILNISITDPTISWLLNTKTGFAVNLLVILPIARAWSNIMVDKIQTFLKKKQIIKKRTHAHPHCCEQ